MLKEKSYDFRKRLLTVHRSGLYDKNIKPHESQFWFYSDAKIKISRDAGDVIVTAANDFTDFLKISMNLSASVVYDEDSDISVAIAGDCGIDLGDYAVYRGFVIDVSTEGIKVYANDERGAAQALYYIEDLMYFAKAPAVRLGRIEKKPLFSPQMVHSGYGIDEYPDEYLARIAHEGRDAILVFVEDRQLEDGSFVKFNELIKRAARFGIDVYAYSKLMSNMSPESAEAEEYYEKSYGKLFRLCPGFKGVTLVGESVEFPSKDPNVAEGRYFETAKDGIPSDKRSSGWYPCYDYPVWLDFIKKIIRKYKPEADIVFWTYNWGFQPEELRVKLIENLPTDISLQATFEMFEERRYGASKGFCADYTLSFEGPGKYFKSEAIAAKKRGIRLYSMTNTAGVTWDIGVIPYQPMPHAWMKRYEAMQKAHDEWGLCGIMEGHHFGLYPSFISKLSKHCFMEPRESMEGILEKILVAEFGEENYINVDRALKHFSEGCHYYTPSDSDQYGAFRVGPSYPFCLEASIKIPSSPEAMFGNSICTTIYECMADNRHSPLGIRIHDEINMLNKMLEYFENGVGELKDAKDKNERLLELINLGQFMTNTVKTGINAKKWYILKCQAKMADNVKDLSKIYDEMEILLRLEIANAEETIDLVEQDSRLGWEPSMLYMTDKWHLEWKIRQVNYVINTELKKYREEIQKHLE